MQTNVVLKNANFTETTYEDGSRQLVGLVQGDSFLSIDIPTDPNPRQFIGSTNPHFTEMVKTLKAEPQLFSRKNSGGISMFASACNANGDGSYTVIFEPGDGIANGIHTFNALKVYGRANSRVKVSIDIGLRREDMVDIAESLNLSRRLPYTTLQNKKGAYDWHKEFLRGKAEEVSYHEGDSGLIEIREELAFLNLFKYDTKTKEIDILRNLAQSEVSNSSFAQQTIGRKSQQFEDKLKWISLDVHNIVVYITTHEKFVGSLKPLRKSSRQRWIKLRGMNGSERQEGVVKGLALLIVAGLAAETTVLNKNGITMWRPEFKEEAKRFAFIDELFAKVFDIVTVEEGASSQIVRMESVRKKVLRHAHLIRISMMPEDNDKKKLLQDLDALQLQFKNRD